MLVLLWAAIDTGGEEGRGAWGIRGCGKLPYDHNIVSLLAVYVGDVASPQSWGARDGSAHSAWAPAHFGALKIRG